MKPDLTTQPRLLHLHTLESLIADLVSGRPVLLSGGEQFILHDLRARSALDWYRKRGAIAWTANVSSQHGEELVDAILLDPSVLPPLPARPPNADSRRLRLKKLEAHRFAGLHKFGTPSAAPPAYVHEFSSDLTLFEGRNGSGKTSLINAIVWALTGDMLRPQREPEAPEDFECRVDPAREGEDQTTHKLSSLTPMPNVAEYRPDKAWVNADTWVELTFVDETGAELPAVRRSQSRTPQGKLRETPPDLSILGLDPIAYRIGTVMPGLLPLIKVGSESELGRAVAQLTGLSALVNLADHVRRAKGKIDKDFVKARTTERDEADGKYNLAKGDLEGVLADHPNLAPSDSIPAPSDDPAIESALALITEHFENAKAAAFESARDVLGPDFNPGEPARIAELERNLGGALERVRRPQELPSAVRLGGLRKVTPEQLSDAEKKTAAIVAEARALEELAKDPATATRRRLYARVAAWIAEHPDPKRDEDMCQVCGGDLTNVTDPVAGELVKQHLHEAAADADLLSQTLHHWAANALGDLMRSLPSTLATGLSSNLPDHPCDLLRMAFIIELFQFEPFRGVLASLKSQTANAFDEAVKDRTDLTVPITLQLPDGCEELGAALKRLDHAIRFARWRQQNDALARTIFERVLGQSPKPGEASECISLTGKLLELDRIAKAAKPISDSLLQCSRLSKHLKTRRTAEKRLREYTTASTALAPLIKLGELADAQVEQLRQKLRKEAALWRSRIYLGAYPDTAHELVDTAMGRKGEITLFVQAGGVAAPAQHVTNASALRASLVAFFLAFWEHVLKERGGLTILLLDDPQELLDDENRERLAEALAPLVVTAGAQLIVTSYDPRFCGRVARLQVSSGPEHLEVHPATQLQPVVRTTIPLPLIERRKARFEADRNAEEPAREFADACRVFFEAKLGDMLDDPAHLAWAKAHPHPTFADFVQRLRPLVKSAPQGMFSGHVFRRFVDHPALADHSAMLTLLNKSHHGRRQEIRPADVTQCAGNLSEVLEIVEQMSDECYRWRRRDVAPGSASAVTSTSLTPMEPVEFDVLVCPDLAAFTDHAPSGESQENPERLDPRLLANAATFYLRRNNFGFAAPQGALALVEAVPGPAADRRLVVARYGDLTYARRFLKGTHPNAIALTADVPDPRTGTPKTIFLGEEEVTIHQVVGILFGYTASVAPGRDEAVSVDATAILKRVELAYRVIDESAVPLALEKQVVLGGPRIDLRELDKYEGELAAVTLDDGSSIFKRIGVALPGDFNQLRQFESIGGLGSSQVLAVGNPVSGFYTVTGARLILGVVYHG